MCKACDDVKYIRLDVEMEHPSFGKAVPCPVCNVADALCGLYPNERKIEFADIDVNGRPGARSMLDAARKFIADGRTGFLTVHGGFGNGKSTLLKAIVNDCIAARVDVRYISMIDVMAFAREAFESEQRGDSDYGRIMKLARTQVLVIDEVDKARVTEYAREVQTHLFEQRYRQSLVLGTVLAWNGGFDDLDLPWVRSRLSEFAVVENNDADLRPYLGGG
jgi:chromosomal replication initiation ATPase DnaA